MPRLLLPTARNEPAYAGNSCLHAPALAHRPPFGGSRLRRGAVLRPGTDAERSRVITREGLNNGTNLCGTKSYELVGVHASHVIVGLVMLALISVLAW